ncbi:caspase family protein [Nocardia sp. NPDC004711]
MSQPRSALIIANATYTDQDLIKLRAPVRDADAMADVLADPQIGAFAVTRVVDKPQREIQRAIATFLANRGVQEVVLVYLSCHGVLDQWGRLHFATIDTVKDELSSTAVEARWLRERMEECRARRQILILDCCHSGAFANTKGGTQVDLGHRFATSGRGRIVLTASRDGEYSFEGRALNRRAAVGSVFTTGLVEGLRTGGADHDHDGLITVEDAYAYAATHVLTHGATQNPQKWTYGGEDPIILARNHRARRTETSTGRTTSTTTTQTAAPRTTQSLPPKQARVPRIVALIASVIVLLGGAVVLYFSLQTDASKSPPAKPATTTTTTELEPSVTVSLSCFPLQPCR